LDDRLTLQDIVDFANKHGLLNAPLFLEEEEGDHEGVICDAWLTEKGQLVLRYRSL